MRIDEEFLRALEHGMPPSGGMGMGIDRLLMAITGLGIRETILFPLVQEAGPRRPPPVRVGHGAPALVARPTRWAASTPVAGR